MKKYHYSIAINRGKATKAPIGYSYGRTKDIQLCISKGKAEISFYQSVKKDPNALLTSRDKLCADAMKKAMLLHLICYGESLDIREIELRADEEAFPVLKRRKKDPPLIYSLIEAPPDHSLPATWKTKPVFDFLLSMPKSRYDARMNAVIALLIGKSQYYACEKALYLWISMNAFYNYFSEQRCKFGGEEREEWKKQKVFAYMMDLPESSGKIEDEKKKPLARKAMSLLSDLTIEPEVLYDAIENNEKNEFSEKLAACLAGYELKIHPMHFMIIWLPYQIRCNYFHGNQAMPLFLYADEYLLRALGYTNYFVERYIEEHLPQWLSLDELTEEHKEKLKSFKIK